VTALTDQQRQDILDEIVAMGQPRYQRDFEFTRAEYQERTGLTLDRAKGELMRMVWAGKLKREMAFVSGKWAWVYWRPADEPCDEPEAPS